MAQQFVFHTPKPSAGEKVDVLEEMLKVPEKTDRKRGSKSRRVTDYAKAEARREADELFNQQMNLNKK